MNIKFNPLEWIETKSLDGRIVRMKADVEIKLSGSYIIYSLFNIFEDNQGTIWLGIQGNFKDDAPKYPVGNFETGKIIADGIYQTNMTKIYKDFVKLIVA